MAISITEKIPLSIAAQQRGVTPDRMRRMICTGEVEGEQVDGRWFVNEPVEDAAADRQPIARNRLR